jgi:hemolysin III
MTASEERHERANALTHGVGLVAGVFGGTVLLVMAAGSGDPWRIVTTAVFATTVILVYASSTLFHSARSRQLRARLRLLDHCAIYLLIAGSYTPFALVGLGGSLGWSLFGMVWVLAGLGILFKLRFIGGSRIISATTYVGMSFLAILPMGSLLQELGPVTLGWLLLGGAFYLVGLRFYLDGRIPYNHAIWHLFVIGGTVCHGIAVSTQL